LAATPPGQYSTGELEHPTTNIQCPDARRKGQGRKSGGSRRESAQIDSPNLIVDSGKPAVSIRHDQADQGQKLKTGSQERREENEECMKKSEERRKTMTFEDLEGWQPARQLSEVGGGSRRTPQIKAGQPPLSSLRSALFRMNCRQPPHTALFAPDALRSAWPKHDRGLHGPRWELHVHVRTRSVISAFDLSKSAQIDSLKSILRQFAINRPKISISGLTFAATVVEEAGGGFCNRPG
jgi:hypothetical protein